MVCHLGLSKIMWRNDFYVFNSQNQYLRRKSIFKKIRTKMEMENINIDEHNEYIENSMWTRFLLSSIRMSLKK